ncbi:MAG: tRNA modification GTPase [Bacteriovoracaceae bacterium]
MKFLYSDDPIIACSTCNHANAALAVIRMSGFKDFSTLASFFTISGPIEPRRVYFTKLVLQGQFIDEVCLTYFAGPKSFNGENILELSIHGNTLNTERIINLFVEHVGFRLANPGEFTYRAMKNKKLSLSQVEGLDLFLNANSSYALDQGLSLLSGNLHAIYLELWDLFLKHKSSLELSIDFSEDVGEDAAREHYLVSLENFAKKFKTLVKRVEHQDANLIQPEIVIAGLPNAGKSSLFNFLLSDDRAIVSSIAGTTRDYLSETLMIEGVKYRLVDTAGMRDASDQIEAEGVKRAKKKLEQSFFKVLLINPLEMQPGFADLLSLNFDLIFFTHADVPGFETCKKKVIETHFELGSIGAINVSSLGPNWENSFRQAVNKKYLHLTKHQPILLDRHKHLILRSQQILSTYGQLAQSETDVAILSSELNSLGHCISEVIGIVSPEQVLNSIFNNFCIGK